MGRINSSRLSWFHELKRAETSGNDHVASATCQKVMKAMRSRRGKLAVLLGLVCVGLHVTVEVPVKKLFDSDNTSVSEAKFLPFEGSVKLSGESKKTIEEEVTEDSIQPCSDTPISLETVNTVVNMNNEISNAKLTPDGSQIDFSQYDRIHLFHTRKAGGSSLRYWAQKVAAKHGLDYSVQEGLVYDANDWKQTLKDPRRTLVFTSLRPPIERVLSSYEFDCLNQRHMNWTLHEWFHHRNDIEHDLSHEFGGFLRVIKDNNTLGPNHESYPYRRGWIWECASNCYSKWFGGWPVPKPPNATNQVQIPDTLAAAQKLADLEIIWIDDLKNQDYYDWVLHRWNSTDIKILRANHFTGKRHEYTNKEMELLENYNWRDKILYEAIRKKWEKHSGFELKAAPVSKRASLQDVSLPGCSGADVTMAELESILENSRVASNSKLTADGTQIDLSQYDHIHLYHTRKAGGSSLKVWVEAIAEDHNLTFSKQEGLVYDPDDWKQTEKEPKRILVLTSLRPPTKRVLSSYEFDLGQQKKNMTLHEFFHRTNDIHDGLSNELYPTAFGCKKDDAWGKMLGNNHDWPVIRGFVWNCATNCYSKWFGGWPPSPSKSNPKPTPDTKTAAKRLIDIEIIWTDSLKKKEYHDWLLHRFDMEGIPIPHFNPTKGKDRSRYTRKHKSLLDTFNWRDNLLYEALRKKWSHYVGIQLE